MELTGLVNYVPICWLHTTHEYGLLDRANELMQRLTEILVWCRS